MKVYILQTGSYGDRGIVGVYETPEAAMAARPKGDWKRADYGKGQYICWSNGLDSSDAADIEPYEVQGLSACKVCGELVLDRDAHLPVCQVLLADDAKCAVKRAEREAYDSERSV